MAARVSTPSDALAKVPGAGRILRVLVSRPVWLVVPAFVAWSAFHLAGSSWDYDEGAHVYAAWLAWLGHPLYTETFAAYTPGYLGALVAGYQLLGASMVSARFVTVLFAAAGLIGVALCARVVSDDDPLAEWGAIILLWLAPSFFQWSRAAMTDAPSGALMALAIGLSLWFWRDGRLRWLFAAEAALAATLWVKLTAVGGVAAFAPIVWAAARRHHVASGPLVRGSAAVLLLAAAPLLLFDVPRLMDQAIFFHLSKRLAFQQDLAGNVMGLAQFLADHAALTLLAAWGTGFGLFGAARAHAGPVLACAVWFAATFAVLVLQTPLFFAHHPIVLLFPLAPLAGLGVAATARLWREENAGKERGILRRAAAAGIALCALAGFAALPERLTAVVAPPYNPFADEAAVLLQAVTPPGDLLVSDAQVIAFTARRQSPPAFSDTSSARLASGSLSAQSLIDGTRNSGANAVLFWSGRLESSEPYADWVRKNFQPVRSSLQSPKPPYTLLLKEAHPQFPLEARIGDGIRFAGYDLDRRSGAPIVAGQALSVTLYFQRIGPVDAPYTVFVHWLAPDGQLLAQQDRPPLANRYPTDAWKDGEWIVDEFALEPGELLPAPGYHLAIGMYRRETLKRLPVLVMQKPQSDDRILSQPIEVRQAR